MIDACLLQKLGIGHGYISYLHNLFTQGNGALYNNTSECKMSNNSIEYVSCPVGFLHILPSSTRVRQVRKEKNMYV